MSKNFTICLNDILGWEGGFVNNPDDPGGMTNLGVTKATYEEWVGHPVSAEIMRKLTPENVAPLYRKMFWDQLRCDEMPAGLDLCVFDFGVNAGTGRSACYLQRLVRVTEDGSIGPKTVAAVKEFCRSVGLVEAIKAFSKVRRAYYRKLPHFSIFGKGWLRRVDGIEKVAVAMTKVAA